MGPDYLSQYLKLKLRDGRNFKPCTADSKQSVFAIDSLRPLFHTLWPSILCDQRTNSSLPPSLSLFFAVPMAAKTGARTSVRIVVAGDRGTGKSSLIAAAATESFPDNVPSVLPPTHLPADFYADGVPLTIIDSSSRYATFCVCVFCDLWVIRMSFWIGIRLCFSGLWSVGV